MIIYFILDFTEKSSIYKKVLPWIVEAMPFHAFAIIYILIRSLSFSLSACFGALRYRPLFFLTDWDELCERGALGRSGDTLERCQCDAFTGSREQ